MERNGWDGMGVEGKGGEGRKCCGVKKTSLKYTLVKGAIPHREPSLLSTIALFRLMTKHGNQSKESRYAKIINYY